MTQELNLGSLPPEIYLTYLRPYLNRCDIFALRQVNKSFNKIFTDDICWKPFVHYPLKYILCDLKSNSTAIGVAEVLQDISQNEGRHRWLDYFRLQEAHLRNWGIVGHNHYNTINLPIRYMAYMEEVVDDNNEHWVCFSVNDTLDIWNITAQPRALGPVGVGPHSLVRLLPCRKVLVKGEEGCVLALYELLPEENAMQLAFIFRFDEEVPRADNNITRDGGGILHSLYFRFILMNNIFIGYICHLSTPQDWFLHLWNLKMNCKLGRTNLESVIMDFDRYLVLNEVSMRQRFRINLFEGEFPYIIVVLKHFSSQGRFSQINTFDINLNQFTHLIAQTSSEVLSCCMCHNKISVDERVPVRNSFYLRISVYSVPSQAGVQARHLYQWPVAINHNNLNFFNVVLKNSKVFIRADSEVIIVMTDPELHQIEIPMDTGYKILGFIEPKLLLMYDSHKDPTNTEVVVFNIFKQRERLVRSWSNVNTDVSRFQHYFANLVYPSKLILNIESQDNFRIYSF